MRKLIVIILLLFATSAYGTTYYVSDTTGNDSNTCNQASSAWATAKKTITAGIGCLTTTGDIVEIDGGSSGITYTEYIEITGKQGGVSYYTIKGSSASLHNGTVTIATQSPNIRNIFIHSGTNSYLKFENFTVNTTSAVDHGIYAYGIFSYLVFDGLTFTGTYDGADIENGALELHGGSGSGTNCTIQNCIFSATFGLSIGLNGDNAISRYTTVQGNTMQNWRRAGIRSRRHHNSTIKRNYITGPNADNDGSTINGIWLRETNYNLVENNIVYFIHKIVGAGSGVSNYIEVRGMTGCINTADNNTIQNNTFSYSSGNQPYSVIHIADYSSNNIIQNNVFDGSFSYFMTCWDGSCVRTGNIARNNIITGTIASWHECSSDSTGLDHSSGNVTSTSANWLASGGKPSPYFRIVANQNGTALTGNGFNIPTIDYDGVARGTNPDIGAFEFPNNATIGTGTPNATVGSGSGNWTFQ